MKAKRNINRVFMKLRKAFKNTWLKDLLKKFYLTVAAFISNDLITLSSAGAYDFFMSAFPILIMIVTILARVFKASPEVMEQLMLRMPAFSKAFNVERVFSLIDGISTFSMFEIVIAVFIFWMARRFFASIRHGIKVIYRKKIKTKKAKFNLNFIAAEAAIVIFIVLTVIIILTSNILLKIKLPQILLPVPFIFLAETLIYYFPFLFILFFVFLIYYFLPPVKPSRKNAFLCAAGCTVLYFAITVIFEIFKDTAKFNIVYGILGNAVLLLIQVWFLFFSFLFFAQFMYIAQFFNSFVISQLYLLPKQNDTVFLNRLSRSMFIEPPNFFKLKAKNIKAGTEIFKTGDETSDIYYIIEGTVKADFSKKSVELHRGEIFGEFACLFDGKRESSAEAVTDCVLSVISKEEFLETLSIDGRLSGKVLKTIAELIN